MTDLDEMIAGILRRSRTIAMVGYSANPARPSHGVARYLRDRGYRVIPVNPGLAGQVVEGERVAARLAEVGEEVDMVDIFRASDAVPGIVEEALARWPALPAVWMQIGVISEPAAARARAAGALVVMDRCPKIDYDRLFGRRPLAEIAD